MDNTVTPTSGSGWLSAELRVRHERSTVGASTQMGPQRVNARPPDQRD
jgi:hypothetical protein